VRHRGGQIMLFVEGTQFVSGQGQPALFKVNLWDGVGSLAADGGADADVFAIGQDGPVAVDAFDGASGDWKLKLSDSGHVIRRETSRDESAELIGTGRDGASLLVRFSRDHIPHLTELDRKGEPVSGELPMGDATDFWWEKDGPRLIGLSRLEGDEQRYIFFDPHDQAVWNAIVKAYPGEQVTLVDYDKARDRFVVLADSPTEGPAYAVVDMATGTASWIGPEYSGLSQDDIGPVRTVSFHARDGLAISGYLTTPPGKTAKNLPMVVLVHGGPEARDTPGFDWWSQALASRGYAVLRVNYRGSGGFGRDFQGKGFGEWGRKMQTDLSDGVRYLTGEGTIDPKRVCIVGASYGGYAALAGATLDLGVYRCAASIAGPSDLARMISWDKSRETAGKAASTEHYWTRYMGQQNTLDSISPDKHAEAVTVPILLIHGKDDTVVDYNQSQMMANALTRAGKSFEFVTLKAEDHWLSRGPTRLQMLRAVVSFLEKNNPPG
jgi:dipeptidyl aminopeptidase/acylaminoacyl peptidase